MCVIDETNSVHGTRITRDIFLDSLDSMQMQTAILTIQTELILAEWRHMATQI